MLTYSQVLSPQKPPTTDLVFSVPESPIKRKPSLGTFFPGSLSSFLQRFPDYRPTRAGVVLVQWSEEEKQWYMCVARDRRFNELTDFGGGVKLSETWHEAAAREFHEESLDVFDAKDRSSIDELGTVLGVFKNDKMAILFIQVHDIDRSALRDTFVRKASKRKSKSENSDIVWVSVQHFQTLLVSQLISQENKLIYVRVHNLLSTEWDQFMSFLTTHPNQ